MISKWTGHLSSVDFKETALSGYVCFFMQNLSIRCQGFSMLETEFPRQATEEERENPAVIERSKKESVVQTGKMVSTVRHSWLEGFRGVALSCTHEK